MMKKRLVTAVAVGAALLCGVLFLTLPATAAKTGNAQPECYPSSSPSGDTHAKVSDGYIQSAHFEYDGKSGEVVTKGWLRANMEFDVFSGDTMEGHLVVDFYVAGSGPGHFESRCIHEAGTEEDGVDCEDSECIDKTDNFEAEFEGTATGLPRFNGPTPVVAQLAGYKKPGGALVLKVQFEKGTDCSESDGALEGGNLEGSTGKTSGSINADDVDVEHSNSCL
jgi:hypothetical protein